MKALLEGTRAPASLVAALDGRGGEIEKLRRMPDDLVAELLGSGIFRACVPAVYGGDEKPLIETLALIEDIAFYDGSTGWCAGIGATTSTLSAWLQPDAAALVYGDANAITGGHAAMLGTAAPAPAGGLLVNGAWQWGSGTQHCSWVVGGCRMTNSEGKAASGPDGLEQAVVFMRPPQLEFIDTWQVSGLKGTGSVDFKADDVVVEAGLWADPFTRPPVLDLPLSRFPFFGLLACGVTCVSLGIARRALAEFVDLAASKVPFQAARTLAERPTVQAGMARAEADLLSARALLRESVEAAWASAEQGSLSDEQRRVLRLAATNATLSSVRAVDFLYTAAGGSAVYESSPMQRLFRDIHVATQHAMVNERTLEITGRMALGLPTDTTTL
jgi:alkylation response protein AidB-like acyl-CoA dehydrogenase